MHADGDLEQSPASPVEHSKFWRLERFWILGNLLYSGFRVLLAWGFLAKHGLSVFWFSVVELVSAVPWAIATSRLTKALVARRWDGTWRWAALATAAFLAPDAYVVLSTHHVPWWVYAVIAGWVSIAAIVSVRKIATAVRERRDAGEAPRTPAASPPSQR
jgi:hypothetical protein